MTCRPVSLPPRSPPKTQQDSTHQEGCVSCCAPQPGRPGPGHPSEYLLNMSKDFKNDSHLSTSFLALQATNKAQTYSKNIPKHPKGLCSGWRILQALHTKAFRGGLDLPERRTTHRRSKNHSFGPKPWFLDVFRGEAFSFFSN